MLSRCVIELQLHIAKHRLGLPTADASMVAGRALLDTQQAALPFFGQCGLLSLLGELSHLADQVCLAFEADTRQVRQRNEALFDLHAIRETAVRLE